MADPIDNREDIIDSRNVIERIEELQERAEAEEEAEEAGETYSDPLDDDEREELAALLKLQEQGEGYSDWKHGATLIRDSYFKEYAQELAKQKAVTLTWEHLREIVSFGKEHGFTDMTLPQLLELREISKGHDTFASYREANPEGSAKEIERIRKGEPHRRGLVLKIKRDDTAENPLSADWLGSLACWHKRHTLGHEQPAEDPTEFQESLPEDTIVLPLYLYDHSGITMRTTPFSCRFDSGQVGIIYATPERIREILGHRAITYEVREQVISTLEAEVKLYDAYLRGDAWGFVLENEDGEHIDSCWGFYGDDKDGIACHLDDDAKALLDAAWEARR